MKLLPPYAGPLPVLALAAAIAATAPVMARAQSTAEPAAAEPQRVTILGRVIDQSTRLPISGVTVEVRDLGVSVRSDAGGRFEIKGILVGVYELAMRAPGYRPSQGNLAIMRDGEFTTTLAPLDGATAPAHGRLVGRVVDARSGAPVHGARVRVDRIFLDVLTDQVGRFHFGSVPPGRHVVEFTNLGYAARVDTLEVASGLTTDARVTLASSPLEVEPITVTVERREIGLERVGFYERRDIGLGDFIDREAIERQAPQEITDVLERLQGVEVRYPVSTNPLLRAVLLRGGRRDNLLGGTCYPSIYIDGVLVHRAGDEPAYLNEIIGPDQVAGVEVFQGAAEVPVQYGGTSASCGVIAVWTR